MTVGMVMFVLNILKTKFMSNQICPICGAQDLRMKFENTLKNGYNLKI